MKHFLSVITILVLSVTVVACGQSNNSDNPNQNDGVTNNQDQNDNSIDGDDTITNNNSSDEIQKKMDELDYIDFELEVRYANDKEYEVKIEQDDDGIEAKLEDELNGIKITGEEAFNEIYPIVQKLAINQDTSKEDAIQQTLDAFGLDADYTKFDLELKFQDHTKIEFQANK